MNIEDKIDNLLDQGVFSIVFEARVRKNTGGGRGWPICLTLAELRQALLEGKEQEIIKRKFLEGDGVPGPAVNEIYDEFRLTPQTR